MTVSALHAAMWYVLLAGSTCDVLCEVLFRKEVFLDHRSWGREDTELEQFIYHDWEIVSIKDSVLHFCAIHAIKDCSILVHGVHSSIQSDPHLMDRFDPGNDDVSSHLHVHSDSNVNQSYLSPVATVSQTNPHIPLLPAPRTNYHLLDLKNTPAADLDWIMELFPPHMKIHLWDPDHSAGNTSSDQYTHSLAGHHDVTSEEAISAPLAPSAPVYPDILLINVVSNLTVVREYLREHRVLVLIHLSDEWYGKKYSHALLTEVSVATPLLCILATRLHFTLAAHMLLMASRGVCMYSSCPSSSTALLCTRESSSCSHDLPFVDISLALRLRASCASRIFRSPVPFSGYATEQCHAGA